MNNIFPTIYRPFCYNMCSTYSYRNVYLVKMSTHVYKKLSFSRNTL